MSVHPRQGEATSTPRATPAGRCGAQRPARRRINSQDLFQGGHELEITHAGETYRLRLTRNEKLILTK